MRVGLICELLNSAPAEEALQLLDQAYRDAAIGDPDAQLVALLRSQAPLRRALAAIAGRLFTTRAWERLGYARSADYAAERAGCSAPGPGTFCPSPPAI